MKNLSAYIITANCTDLTDCCDGLIEMLEAINVRRRAGKRVFEYYKKRRNAIRIKLVKIYEVSALILRVRTR